MKNFLNSPRLHYLFAGVGIVCMVLQAVFFAAVDDRGLLFRGHPAAIVSWVLVAAAAVVSFLARKVRRLPKCPAAVRGAGIGAGALGIAVTAVTLMARGDWMTAVPAALGALALGYVAWCRVRGVRYHFLAYGGCVIFLMFYLISRYRGWSAEPESARYILRLLALVCLMLSVYQKAALGAGMGKREDHGFFTSMAMLLSFAAVPGSDHPLLFLGVGIWLLLDPRAVVRKKKMQEQAP